MGMERTMLRACANGRLREAESLAPKIKHEADGFRGVGLRKGGLGTGPLRDSQRSGFRQVT